MTKVKPEAIYPTNEKEVITTGEDRKSVRRTKTVPNYSKTPENQEDIDDWEDINDKGRGSIMLCLHPVIWGLVAVVGVGMEMVVEGG